MDQVIFSYDIDMDKWSMTGASWNTDGKIIQLVHILINTLLRVIIDN